jgi:hypothetical protein
MEALKKSKVVFTKNKNDLEININNNSISIFADWPVEITHKEWECLKLEIDKLINESTNK